jgi:CRP/FNR family transcriptional regulator, nitrogen fixation regulation protein
MLMWHSISGSSDRELAAFETDGWTSLAATNSRDPLESIGTVVCFPRNREIYAQSDPPLYVYKMISGAVRTCKHFADGRRQVGGFHLADDVFGLEMGVAHLMSAEAISNSRIVVIRRPALMSLAERETEVALRLWALTTRELRWAHDHVMLLMKSAPERVASLLLALAERMGKDGSIDLPMPRRDIAEYLGLTIETISRVLSDLQAVGAIELPSSHRVVFRDRTALEKLRG